MLTAHPSLAAVTLQVDAVDSQHVRVAVTNSTAEPLVFLRWGSPFESPLTNDLFRIESTESGEQADFKGRLVKRIGPQPEEFIELAPDDTLDAIVPITRYYRLPSSGQFEITLWWTLQILSGDELNTQTFTSNTAVVELFSPPEIIAARPALFDSCTVEQQQELQVALQEAENLAVESRDALLGLPLDSRANSPRYTQWFGAYTPGRYDRVSTVFTNLADILATETIGLSCDCDRFSWYAFVYPAFPYEIYLCPAFWRAPLLGRDSRAGTLIHEMTHFPATGGEYGGTADHAYSLEAASLSPELAVDNADNYEYFAENVPALLVRVQSEESDPAQNPEQNDQQAVADVFYPAAGVFNPLACVMLGLLYLLRIRRNH